MSDFGKPTYSRVSNNRRVWNNRIRWTYAPAKLNVWYGIIVLGGKIQKIINIWDGIIVYWVEIFSTIQNFCKLGSKFALSWHFESIWNFFMKLINSWYGISKCWVENFGKINKRTPTLIGYSTVVKFHFIHQVPVLLIPI